MLRYSTKNDYMSLITTLPQNRLFDHFKFHDMIHGHQLPLLLLFVIPCNTTICEL